MSRVTLRQVAAASGVSPSTVSFVLNDRPDQSISAATRNRVIAAARELGYTPNGIARALVEGSSRIVIVIDDARLAGNYGASFIRGFDAELGEHGFMLLVRDRNSQTVTEKALLDAISPRAVYYMGEAYRPGHEAAAESAGHGWPEGLAAHTATQVGYLAERGHAEVVLALPDRPSLLADARMAFTAQAARELGMAEPRSLVIPDDRAEAAQVLSAFRLAHPSVTAVAGLDDEVALLVLAAMHDLGLGAPADLAVIGYDDTPYGAISVPALTTVHIDAEARGRYAARALLGLDPAEITLVPAQIVVRESA